MNAALGWQNRDGRTQQRAHGPGSKVRPANRRVAPGRATMPPAGHSRRIHRRRRPAARRSGLLHRCLRRARRPTEIERRFALGRPAYARSRRVLSAPGETADRGWPLSHLPLLIDEAEWRRSPPASCSARNCWKLVLADLYGEGRLVARARAGGRRSPAAPNICARSAASSRRAAVICNSTPPISAAGPMGAGGCWATVPRRRRARAMRWRTASCCRAPFRRSTSR